MALIPEAVGTPSGTVTAARLPVNGDTINPGDDVQLVFINGSAGSVTVTITAVKPCNQGSLHDSVSVVAAGATKMIGPVDRRYASNSNGLATVNYTGTLTSTTVYATRV